jgi:glycosyltransferase involved in cell wall biosynthesis
MYVAIVNTFNAKDVTNWAGIPYHLSELLEKMLGKDNVDCVHLPPFKRSSRSYLLGFFFNKVISKKYYTWGDKHEHKRNRKKVRIVLKKKYDLIITFEFFLVSLLKRENNKIVYWNDATFKNLINFYSGYSKLCNYCLTGGHSIQKEALNDCDAIIFSSDWAINTAVKYYQANPNKIQKISFASNLDPAHVPSETEINKIIESRDKKVIKLLFLGADWKRKGGDIAVQVLNNLNEKGFPAILFVVGANVPKSLEHNSNIIPLGFINKRYAEGKKKISQLLKESTYLILPTMADCTPVAFSEASSCALPILSTNVGGIPSVIKKNTNGYYFETDQFREGATHFIIDNLPETGNYSKLCESSFKHYSQEMSWKQVETKFVDVLRKLDLAQD